MKIHVDDQKELWRWAVHNRIFELTQTLSEINSTFNLLADGKVGVFDSWSLMERQIRVCALELENLKKMVTNIGYKPVN